jgi:hypothetical protein
MRVIDLRLIDDAIVIHFKKKGNSINAYTLASSLVSFADAAKAANDEINPGYDIEILIESLSDGSFKAKLKAIYKSANSLFSTSNVKTIILSLLSAYIYQHTFAPDNSINIHVTDELVVMEQGDTKVIIPKEIHKQCENMKNNKKIKQAIGSVFETVKRDETIDSISIDGGITEDKELPELSNDEIDRISEGFSNDMPNEDSRIIFEEAKINIIKAILEKSNRKWEFSWNGMKISAPVNCDSFYEEFAAHKITIAPGDSLSVKLKITQKKHDFGIYLNQSYEVIEVLSHNSTSKINELGI